MADQDFISLVPDALKPVLFSALRDEADRIVTLAAAARLDRDRQEAREAAASPDERAFLDDPAFGPTAAERRASAEAEIAALRESYFEAQGAADRLAARRIAPLASDKVWDDALAAAREKILAARTASEAEARARADRTAAADCMTWQEMAETLWGPDFITPLAIVAGCNKRTIERANRPDGRLPGRIGAWLADTIRRVPEDLRRPYGLIMRGAMTAESGAEAARLAQADLEMGRLP